MDGNPREHCNAIILRNGKVVEERKPKEVVVPTSDPILQGKSRLKSRKLRSSRKSTSTFPFAKALTQMSNYVKFSKEVMSKKRNLEEFETVKLTEECSTILQKKLPHKLKDPGSFNILCNIGGITFDRTLYRSITYPKGIIEDLLVKVDKFIFSVDFVVLDKEEDEKVLLILCRLFLAIRRALIDCKEGS
ncbi:uncharacterized protein LOC111383942 [Olea europaea var. sylvestris]|uniref:uncharacterized protein LOC111383942 n=1 Tax=Olea europaea var. sylvestris TaxID=158386 RepID=UPI000C1D086A|nr:uncharacterized protein LOC111383942 [Olea europaea var. sylvestris]